MYYQQFIKDFAKSNPGPNLFKRASAEWNRGHRRPMKGGMSPNELQKLMNEIEEYYNVDYNQLLSDYNVIVDSEEDQVEKLNEIDLLLDERDEDTSMNIKYITYLKQKIPFIDY